MKLSNDYLKDIQVRFISLADGRSRSIGMINNLFSHISELEQELTEKSEVGYIALNKNLRLLGTDNEIFKVRKMDEFQSVIVEGIRKGTIISSEHFREVDVIAELTESKQENLMRLGEVEMLQSQYDELDKLCDTKFVELERMEQAHKKLLEQSSQVSEFRLVKLPKDVAEELQKERNSRQTDYSIISGINWRIRHNEALSKMTSWANQHNSPFLRALADGYTIEESPEDNTIRVIALKINALKDISDGVDESEIEVARDILNYVNGLNDKVNSNV